MLEVDERGWVANLCASDPTPPPSPGFGGRGSSTVCIKIKVIRFQSPIVLKSILHTFDTLIRRSGHYNA